MVKKAKPKRRMGAVDSPTRIALLEAAERVIARDGYAALASRRVAQEAGLKQQLVYYYFQDMEELVIASYRFRVQIFETRVQEAFASERPWHAYWEVMSDRRTRLFTEYMSMANRSERLHEEMKRTSARLNDIQHRALAKMMANTEFAGSTITPALFAFLITSVARSQAAEGELEIISCAAELDAFIQSMLNKLEA